jgi:translation initiation factor IF-2
MYNDLGKQVREAKPSEPVSVLGLSDVPVAGDKFMVIQDERKARQISETRAARSKTKSIEGSHVISLEEMFKSQDGQAEKVFKLIIKSDTSGTSEAVKSSVEKIGVEGVKVSVVRSSVGPVTESDVLLAQASEAVIIAFNVICLTNVKDFAKSRGIEVRYYNIIYKLIEDIEGAMKGMLAPVYEDRTVGQAEVRETYKISKLGTVAGCMVTDGFVRRTSGVEIVRDGTIIYTGKLSSLKRFKDDAREVKAGYDCGLMVENFNDLKVGDILTFTITEEVTNEE